MSSFPSLAVPVPGAAQSVNFATAAPRIDGRPCAGPRHTSAPALHGCRPGPAPQRRLLLVGSGDVARRALPLLVRRYRVYAVIRDPADAPTLRALGAVPVVADLDRPASLRRLAGLAGDVLHLAPPPDSGERDPRTARLLAALARGLTLPHRLVYISTSGVYGDCAGARIDETRPAAPHSARGKRRVDAEARVRSFARRNRVAATVLRVPGIYAADRLPVERLKRGTPALLPGEDGYTNHIHADDLAAACAAALARGRPGRVVNACDDSELTMGDWFDAVAEAFALPRPPRIGRAEAERTLSPALLSFMNESRRLSNRRLKRELRLRLIYPTVAEGLAAAVAAAASVPRRA